MRVVIVVAPVPVGSHRSYPSLACSSPGSCLDITIGCAATDAAQSNLSGIVRRSSYFPSFRSRNIVSLDDYNATTTEQKTSKNLCTTSRYPKSNFKRVVMLCKIAIRTYLFRPYNSKDTSFFVLAVGDRMILNNHGIFDSTAVGSLIHL
jgi:hypothetical protein